MSISSLEVKDVSKQTLNLEYTSINIPGMDLLRLSERQKVKKKSNPTDTKTTANEEQG